MGGVLVYAECRGGIVQSVTHELLSAARHLAKAGLSDVTCCAFGTAPAELVDQLKGADQILTMQHPALSPYGAEGHGIALRAAIDACAPDVVLIPYSSAGLDLGSFVSAKTGRPLVAYCTKLDVADGALTASSQLYGGKLMAATSTSLPAIAAVVPGSFDEAEGKSGGRGVVTALPAPPALDALRTRFVSASEPEANQIDLTKSDRIVSIGRGIGTADKIALAEEFASLIGADLAGSRPIIDSGWLPKARQVGKSGQKVKPKLYIAVGISGAPEHLEGMKSADCIIAINSDEKAPIFDVAHVGTTCDLFELLPALNERLAKL